MSDAITPSFTAEPADKPAAKPGRKPGPGRPPGSTKAAASATNDVRQAMASLDMLYEIIATGLLMWGKPVTAQVWQDKSATLRDTNENALKASPKLAKFLAGAGQTSGAITFLTTHAVAFGAVAMTLQLESSSQRPEPSESSENAGASPSYLG
jgi:hypothetical protein